MIPLFYFILMNVCAVQSAVSKVCLQKMLTLPAEPSACWGFATNLGTFLLVTKGGCPHIPLAGQRLIVHVRRCQWKNELADVETSLKQLCITQYRTVSSVCAPFSGILSKTPMLCCYLKRGIRKRLEIFAPWLSERFVRSQLILHG